MAGCSAINCSNRANKGFRTHRFPTDKTRFQLWAKQCGRELDPSKSYRLCEMHFESNQYELHRADGRKLLRWNAVPTIFNYLPPLVPSKTKRVKNIIFNVENDSSFKKCPEVIPGQHVSCELNETENSIPYRFSLELHHLRENISCNLKKSKGEISFGIENVPCVAVGVCALEECKQGCTHENIINDFKTRISELENKLISMQEELYATKVQLRTNKRKRRI